MNKERMVVDYLHDIVETIPKAQKFVEGLAYQDFIANDEKVFAVIRALEIRGSPPLVHRRITDIMRSARRKNLTVTIHYSLISNPRPVNRGGLDGLLLVRVTASSRVQGSGWEWALLQSGL